MKYLTIDKPFLVTIITVVIGLLFFEILLRAFMPVHLSGHIGAYQYDHLLGIKAKSNIHLFQTTDYQQEIRTNSLGTINFEESFNEYESLIFAIGDSFTQGTGLPSDASYPFQLAMKLNMQHGVYIKEYAVVNLGLASYGGEQSRITLELYEDIIGIPNYILYLGYSNDTFDDILFESGYRHSHLVEGNPKWGIWLLPLQFITNQTEIGKRLKLSIGFIRRKSFFKSDITPKTINVAKQQTDKLNKILEISRSNNSHLIVSWANVSDGSYIWLKKWAKNNNVSFADWENKLASVLLARPNLPIKNNHTGAHYRTWVNSLIAEAYEDKILLLENNM